MRTRAVRKTLRRGLAEHARGGLARGRVLALTGLGALAFGSSLLAATPRSAPSSGPCSKQEAVRVVDRLHLGNADDPDVSDPVAQVLCGAFAGPGSQAMVASLAIPSCGRTAGWVVFRRSGATWQLVMERNNGADLDAVGTGIRETQFVLRPRRRPLLPDRRDEVAHLALERHPLRLDRLDVFEAGESTRARRRCVHARVLRHAFRQHPLRLLGHRRPREPRMRRQERA